MPAGDPARDRHREIPMGFAMDGSGTGTGSAPVDGSGCGYGSSRGKRTGLATPVPFPDQDRRGKSRGHLHRSDPCAVPMAGIRTRKTQAARGIPGFLSARSVSNGALTVGGWSRDRMVRATLAHGDCASSSRPLSATNSSPVQVSRTARAACAAHPRCLAARCSY